MSQYPPLAVVYSSWDRHSQLHIGGSAQKPSKNVGAVKKRRMYSCDGNKNIHVSAFTLKDPLEACASKTIAQFVLEVVAGIAYMVFLAGS